ncbi:hypothetical protein JKA74_11510 [Marivirga sp. S37H4]|uniref:ATP-grasp domain-containing protein n=1 Tax=Marivirga aurantiaca TaxID=2802615 RepID=A0A934WZJ7_9BACT|nr:hypothetical protein [Marivirga aurantiaca]MBK6265666.1 hypothetical protein [Marivirga aurantiaca]
MLTLLYLTDLYYQAKGRNYYEEDLYITSKLKEHFNILIGHPQQAIPHLGYADLIVFRNTGPVGAYQEYFDHFVALVKENDIPTFNSFDGKADMKGKQYLLDLYESGYPVIPTVETFAGLASLQNSEKYVVKLKNGADSIGMDVLTHKELFLQNPQDKLIQPFINFQYELSFYFLNNIFQYALYAPHKDKRWELHEYDTTLEDLAFAKQFIEWNNMERGITRVDACRQQDGSLLLVELEDLNPFLSIDTLTESKRNEFIENFTHALLQVK